MLSIRRPSSARLCTPHPATRHVFLASTTLNRVQRAIPCRVYPHTSHHSSTGLNTWHNSPTSQADLRLAGSHPRWDRSAVAVASISMSAPNDWDSQHQAEADTPWWGPHQQALQLISSAFWAACIMAGAWFWASWATKAGAQAHASASQEPQTTAASAAEGTAADTRALPGATTGSPGKAPVDDMSDPWAPIKYIWRRTFGQQPQTPPPPAPPEPEDDDKNKAQRSQEQTSGTAMRSQEPQSLQVMDATVQPPVSQPTASGSQQPLPPGWWRDLNRVHYINFGARLGILPRLVMEDDSTDSLGSGYALVAFADRVDAEYVGSSLRLSMQLSTAASDAASQLQSVLQPAGSTEAARSAAAAAVIRPQVVGTAPVALEDMMASRGAQLVVVPQGALAPYYNCQLTEAQLLLLLRDLVSGRPPSVTPVTPQQPAAASSLQASAEAAQLAAAASLGSVSNSTAASVVAGAADPPATSSLPAQTSVADAGTSTQDDKRQAVADAMLTRQLQGLAETGQQSFDFGDFEVPHPQPQTQPQRQTQPAIDAEPRTAQPAARPAELASSDAAVATPQAAIVQSHTAPSTQPSTRPQDSLVQIAEFTDSPTQPQPQPQSQSQLQAELETAVSQSSSAQQGSPVGEDSQPDTTKQDPVLAEYEAFKKMFFKMRQNPVHDRDSQALPTDATNEAAAGPSKTESSAVAATQRIEQLLASEGPTDAALAQAWSAMPVPTASTRDEDLEEWYSLQEQLNNQEAATKQTQSTTQQTQDNSGGATVSGAGQTGSTNAPTSISADSSTQQKRGVRAAFAAAAARKRQGADAATTAVGSAGGADLQQMQAQLDAMQRQLQQLMASSGSGDPASQAAASSLQSGMKALSENMAAMASSGTAAGTANPSQPVTSATTPTTTPPTATTISSSSQPAVDVSGSHSTSSQSQVIEATAVQEPVSTSTSTTSSVRKGWGTGWVRRKGLNTPSGSSANSSSTQSLSSTNTTASQSASPSKPPPAAPAEPQVTDDGAVILSKRAGKERPWKRTRDPGERQETVKEAVRFAAAAMNPNAPSTPVTIEYDDEGRPLPPPDPTIDRVAGIDWDSVRRDEQALEAVVAGDMQRGMGLDTGREKWWQRRYEAVFVPNIRFSDDSVGFLQVNCSLQDDTPDMRVVLFEDRHDCMHCLTVMREWPEYEWHELEMGLLPTKAVELEVVRAWQSQVAAGAVSSASRPAGVVVFRRGKLPMRVGMSQYEFTQLVVYQAAAQLSLSKVGYQFDDF